MKRTPLALVGLGKIAVDQHIPSMAKDGSFELAAIVSRRGAGHGEVPVFTSLEALLSERPDIGAVSFCTPPEGRYRAVALALEAGRHVMVEKPPTATLAELHDLENRSRRAGRVLFTTWHCQFNPGVDRVREILAREGVNSVNVRWRESIWRWHPGQEWIWEAGGFGVFDPGINALSILTAVLPFPLFVREARFEVPQGRQMPIAARIRFDNPDNIPVEAEFDWRERQEEVWDIAIVSGKGQNLLLSRGGGELRINKVPIFEGPKAEYPPIYRRFAELIEMGRSEVDAAPLRLTADAFLVAKHEIVAPFNW